MADAAAPPPPSDETPNQRKARERRERMQTKMASSGEERLAKIKALNGGVAPPDETLGGPAAPSLQAQQSQSQSRSNQASVDDPDEADIDTVSGMNTPNTRAATRNASAGDPLAQAMFQMQQQQSQQGGQGGGEEDPMVKMMQQLSGMMGGNPQDPNDPNQPPQIPAALQALMGGAMGGNSKEAQEMQKAPETSSTYLWRIVHAVFAVTLATYIALSSTFSGTKLARSQSVYEDNTYGFGPRLFTMFATVELALQSTRFFLEKGQLRGPGFLAKIANSGFVPEPYAQYIRIAGRYIAIAQTIFSDAMVVVFVLGFLAWWKGMAVA